VTTLIASTAITPTLTGIRGRVVFGDDPALPSLVAGFNTALEHRPAVAVVAACVEDVVRAVRYAAEMDLPVGVLATGHSAPAMDGGVLVVMTELTGVTVDAARRVACVEGGAKWAHVLPAITAHGLAPAVGSSSDVGVVGYHLGGGLSPLGRALGYAADHVLSFDIVTADGLLRTVNAWSDPDLFWALRGGKAGFGIVVRIRFRVFPLTRFYGGALIFAADDARPVLHTWRTLAADLPEEIGTSVAALRLPDLDGVPPMLRGRFVVAVRVASLAGAEETEQALAPLRAVATPMIDMVAERPITELDAVHMDPTNPMPGAHVGGLLDELPEDAIEALLAAAGPDVRTPVVAVELRRLGGALSREPSVPNAVGHRSAGYTVFAVAPFPPPLRAIVPGALQAVLDAVGPWLTGGVQANLSHSDTRAEWARAWSPEQAARLVRIRAAYDPADRFAPMGGV
jgi:FAD/FMN-containing dehydrogenase